MKNSFCKEERLYKKPLIDQLFTSEDKIKINEFPLMILAIASPVEEQLFSAQLLISVSKKKIRLAVNRNLIKRRIKEAYRLNKHEFYNQLQSNNKKLLLSIIYLGNKPLPYQLIEEKIIVLLKRLTEKTC